jgi:hypothetical protein
MYVEINGKNHNLKSITFSVLKDKLVSQEKRQTIRTNYLPKYVEGETVAIAWRNKDKTKSLLYLARISQIRFMKIKTIPTQIAIQDGFDSRQALFTALKQLNGSLNPDQYVCITNWIPIETPQQRLKA